MSRRFRYLLIVAAVVVLAAAAVVVDNLRTQRASTSHVGKPTACAYTSHSISALTAFSSLVGSTISCAMVYNSSATSWDQLASPWFLTGNNPDYRWDKWAVAQPGRRLVIAESLVPAKPPADWRAQGAAGAYDATFHTFADKLVAAGLGDSVIRIAAEGNGDWFTDNAGTSKQSQREWASYWARVAGILHGTKGAHFRTDWTISGGPPVVPLDDYYPGDGAVDIVGLDQHDLALHPIGSDQPARWNSQNTTRNGVQTVLSFADRHGKPVSIPEWGVNSVAKLGGGDDAYYMQQMAAVLARGNVVYHGYWEKTGADGLLSANPKALQIYRDQVLPQSAR